VTSVSKRAEPLSDAPASAARLAWRSQRDFDLSLTAQNLFDNSHAEFRDPLPRSEFGQALSFRIGALF
jgi:hypothetical protein